MKARALVMIFTGAVFLGGCSAPMSAADKCKEFKALAPQFSVGAGMSQESRNKITGQYSDLASKSPDALKNDVKIGADYLKVLVADRDVDGASRLQSEYRTAEQRIQAACRAVG